MSEAERVSYPDFVQVCGYGKVDGICGAIQG